MGLGIHGEPGAAAIKGILLRSKINFIQIVVSNDRQIHENYFLTPQGKPVGALVDDMMGIILDDSKDRWVSTFVSM